MGKTSVRVELFFAAGCDRCTEARRALREVAQSTLHAEWKEIDIAKNPDRAADVGAVSTPAVAINGELVFKTMPTPAQLRSAIRMRAGKG